MFEHVSKNIFKNYEPDKTLNSQKKQSTDSAKAGSSGYRSQKSRPRGGERDSERSLKTSAPRSQGSSAKGPRLQVNQEQAPNSQNEEDSNSSLND